MKNKLLLTTAVAALLVSGNAYADDWTVSGSTETVSEYKSVENVKIENSTVNIDGTEGNAVDASGNVNISDSIVEITNGGWLDNLAVADSNSKTTISNSTVSIKDPISFFGAYDMAVNGSVIEVGNEGALLIGNSNASVSSDSGDIIIGEDGKLTINEGMIDGLEEAATKPNLTMDGGELNVTNLSELWVNDVNITGGKVILDKVVGDNFDLANQIVSHGKVTIGDEAEISANASGISAQDSINITGGSLDFQNGSYLGKEYYNEFVTKNINITGGDVNLNNSSINAEKSIAVSGGTLSLANQASVNTDTMTVSGGNLTTDDTVAYNVKNMTIDNGAQVSGDLALKDVNFTLDGTSEKLTIIDGDISITGGQTQFGVTNDGYGLTMINGDVSVTNNQIQTTGNMMFGNNLDITGSSVKSEGLTTWIASNINFDNSDLDFSDKGAWLDGNVSLQNSDLNVGKQNVATQKISFDKDSSLSLIVDNDQSGSLTADSITIAEGAELRATLSQGLVKVGQSKEMTLLDSDNITGEFTPITNNMYGFEYAGNGKYTVSSLSTASGVSAQAGGTINNQNAASAWNDAADFAVLTSGAATADHLIGLAQNDANAYNNALTAIAPEVAPLVQKTEVENTTNIFAAVSSQLSGGSIASAQEGKSSGDNWFERGSAWVKTLFNKSKLDDTSKAKGFDADSTGIALGFDKQINDDVKAGIGYAYTNTDIEGFMRDTDVDTHTAIVYGEYKPSNWYVNGIATYGWSDYEEDKNVAGLAHSAKYDVETFGLQAMTGYDMQVKGYNVTPEAGLRYLHISQDGYTDSADQKVSGNDSDILTAVVGAKASKDFTLENGMILRPEARLAMTYDLLNDDNNATVALSNGASYHINGEELDRFGIEAGAGITAELNDSWDVSAGYEGHYRSDYTDHTGMLNAKYKF